ncbi:MBL fold metallo-hydrolase [Candidatus Microgenomates bacterium]|nr:MAG: MBL fold metallo-hydrolase [Candidatus Microgenomates bacterium]
MNKIWFYIMGVLLLACAVVWLVVANGNSDNLTITACDVGQGDAFLIQRKNLQILVDGGPNSSVIKCLEKNVAFWDSVIELVILTHPQADHATGLIDVFREYKVGHLLANSVNNDTQVYRALKELALGEGVVVLNPDPAKDIRFGELFIDIIYPDTELDDDLSSSVLGSWESSEDLNNFSIMFYLQFKDFDALFTGDASPSVLDKILARGQVRRVEYLKIPHHGSKNGLTQKFFDAANPEISAVGVGANNRFGHPSPEVLEILSGSRVLRTDVEGEATIESNGQQWWVRQ